MFRAIGRAICLILEGIAKICALLLSKLGLWIPALFSLTFVIVCAVTGTKLVGATLTVFCLGLGVSTAGGLLFAFYRFSHRKKKPDLADARPAREKRTARGGYQKTRARADDYEENASARARRTEKGGKRQQKHPAFTEDYVIPLAREEEWSAPSAEKSALYGQTGASQVSSYAREPVLQSARPDEVRSRTADLERKYFGTPQYDCRTASLADTPAPDVPEIKTESVSLRREMSGAKRNDYDFQQDKRSDALGAERLWERLEGARVPEEKPLIFKTRSDPNVYVYEYSDRIQYWRRSGRGMTLLSTKFKNGSNAQ